MRLVGRLAVLRDLEPDDAGAVAAIIGDDRVTYWLSFDSRDRDAAEALVRRAREARQAAGSGRRAEYYLAIVPRDGDRLVGFVRLEPTGVQAAKLGVAVLADQWRRGYAGDAVATAVAFAFDELGLHRVSAAVGPENRASIGLIEHAGFHYEGRLRHHVFTNGAWRDSLLYSRLATDPPPPAGAP